MLKPLHYDKELSEFAIKEETPYGKHLYMELQLADYDLVYYSFKALFPTKDQGILDINVVYDGVLLSTMRVNQTLNGSVACIRYVFCSQVFVSFMKEYLKKHAAQWNSMFPFDGEELAVELFNKILETGHVVPTTDYEEYILMPEGEQE